MRVVRNASEVSEWTEAYRHAALSVGFVPTLGMLHAGHTALLRRARQECDRVVASIYLNPTQFDSEEDLKKYGSASDRDLAVCRDEGVDLLWLGRADDLLPAGFQSWIDVEELTQPLCGARRPGHFRGVATVVTQLLHVVKPHRAYFGRKDYQQVRVVSRMVDDLRFDLEIRCVDTVREPDGLAMSSRNARLSPDERAVATVISRALSAAKEKALAGSRDVGMLVADLRAALATERLLTTEYAEARDGETLALLEDGEVPLDGAGTVIAVAARVGEVRLIDNVVVSR